MKVTGNKGVFKVSAEKGDKIYSFSDNITDSKLMVAKKRVTNLSELDLEEINHSSLEKTIKDFDYNCVVKLKQVASYIETKSGKTDKKRSYVKLEIHSLLEKTLIIMRLYQYVSLEHYEILASDDFLLYSKGQLEPIYFAKKVATYPKGVKVDVIELVGLLMPITENYFRPEI
jgi:hypothetical protein